MRSPTSTRSLLLWIAALGVISLPAGAQTSPGGPVHIPPGYATNAAPVAPMAPAPMPTSLAAPTNAPTPLAAPITLPPAPAANPPASSDDDGDIHDIRGPISIPYPYMWIVYVLLGIAALVGLYFLTKWLRRSVVKPRLAHEIALERLEAARPLMADNQVREYAFAVSEVIRVYIEQRFGERAARRTTEEFLSDLLKQQGTALAQHRALLEDFLNHCDLPKFARWQLSATEMESMHASARTFILNTRPDAPVAPPQPETNLAAAR
jgi:hypothetical protein